MAPVIDEEVVARIERLELPFNARGYDPFGVGKKELAWFFTALKPFYRTYFRVRCEGIESVPERGRAMLVANHGGGIPVDGGMLLAALLLDKEPPRLAHGMVEKFAAKWPFVSYLFDRIGQFTGLPEDAVRLLEDDRMVMVFPEGVRGVGKLYKDRYQLVRFGTGFMRLAMKTNTPIVPVAFIGGEEAVPTLFHLKRPARWIGAPYIPVPPHVLPVPLPVRCEFLFGAPLTFEGDGTEQDSEVERHIEVVKGSLRDLIRQGRARR